MKMKLKKKLIIFFFLLITITLSIINLKNTSKTSLYLLNFKTDRLTLGNFISLSFLTGFTSTLSFLYLTSQKQENNFINDKKFDLESKKIEDEIKENYKESKGEINERPPERDIRESQPTISVKYRVISQKDMEANDINERYRESSNQNYDDWEENESNW